MSLELHEIIEHICNLGPSWKTDISITYSKNGEKSSRWSCEVRDIWSHMHSPVFYGPTHIRVLSAAKSYVEELVADYDNDYPWVDDDCVIRGDATKRPDISGMGEVHLT